MRTHNRPRLSADVVPQRVVGLSCLLYAEGAALAVPRYVQAPYVNP
jgi:hypothetical protein